MSEITDTDLYNAASAPVAHDCNDCQHAGASEMRDPCELCLEYSSRPMFVLRAAPAPGAPDVSLIDEGEHPAPVAHGNHADLLREAAELFRRYEQLHRARGPEHLAKADRNAEIAGRIEDALAPALHALRTAAPVPVAQGDNTDWKAIARVQSAKLHAALDKPGAVERLKAALEETRLDTPSPVAQPLTPAQSHADELLAALREIADDYADRFDFDSPSTNPGIKFTIEQARAVLTKIEATSHEGGAA